MFNSVVIWEMELKATVHLILSKVAVINVLEKVNEVSEKTEKIGRAHV